MLGRLEEAWALALPAAERSADLSGDAAESALAEIASLAGDHANAAAYLRRPGEAREPSLAVGLRATARALDVRACPLRRGRAARASRPRARQRRRVLLADALAAGAGTRPRPVAIGEGTDALNFQGAALCDLAEVLAVAGRADEAAAALEQAFDRYTRKKNLAMLAQVRPKVEELHRAAPA